MGESKRDILVEKKSGGRFGEYPQVPKELSPKPLWHVGITDDEELFLKQLGWDPRDLRLLPCETDAERAAAVKARLEAIRMGTVAPPTREELTSLQIEAKICGLMASKGGVAEDDNMDGSTLDTLLNFNKKRTVKREK